MIAVRQSGNKFIRRDFLCGSDTFFIRSIRFGETDIFNDLTADAVDLIVADEFDKAMNTYN